MMGWDSSWGWTMMFGGVLVWGGLLVLLIWLFQSVLRPSRNNLSDFRGSDTSTMTDHQTPLELLQSRYAKGEIDRDEYLRKQQDLKT